MAAVNGAYASWSGDRIGTLEPGKRADMMLLNLQNIEEPYLDPEVSVVDAVVHRGRSVDVDTVMVEHYRHIASQIAAVTSRGFSQLDHMHAPSLRKQRSIGKPQVHRVYHG